LASKGGSEKAKQQIPQLSHGLLEGVFMRQFVEGYAIIFDGFVKSQKVHNLA